LAKEEGNIEDIIDSGEVEDFEVNPLEVEELFLEPNVSDDYNIVWEDPEEDEIKEFLCEKHDFSESRITTGIERLRKGVSERTQESLEKWA